MRIDGNIFYNSRPARINHLNYLFKFYDNFLDFYWISIGWFIKFSVHTLQPLIVIYRGSKFVNWHWGCTSIYRPLSYALRTLHSHIMILQDDSWGEEEDEIDDLPLEETK